MSTIRIMTHNVWNRDTNVPAWEEKGEDCSAQVRVHGHIRVYKETMPDIIGGQEFSSLMADLIKENALAAGMEYALIWGRYTPILYRADKFELLDTSFTTYPEHIDGFEGEFNDVKSKACNIAVFRNKETGKVFLFATTHLWWKSSDPAVKEKTPKDYQEFSDEAREFQIALLVEKIECFRKKYQCPCVLVGDLNTDYNSKAVKYLLDHGYRHAYHLAVEERDETVGYHDCFPWGYYNWYRTDPFEKAIDHIFLIGEKEGSVKRFMRYSPDYYFPISDHSPAYIDFEI